MFGAPHGQRWLVRNESEETPELVRAGNEGKTLGTSCPPDAEHLAPLGCERHEHLLESL